MSPPGDRLLSVVDRAYIPAMSSYRFETYGELQPWAAREWLLTNGTGSFASGSLAGLNTRRYHGLLVAATMPPVGRILALQRLAESVAIDNHVTPIELSVNQFGSLLIPRGDRYLRQVEVDDTVRFHYDADGARIVKEVLLVWGKSIVGVRYHIDPGPHKQVELRLQPFVALRDFHALTRKNQTTYDLSQKDGSVIVGQRDMKLHLRTDRGSFVQRPDWWYDHTYPVETERGQDDREDLFTPGHFAFLATAPVDLTFWAGLQNGLDKLDFDTEKKRVIESNGVKSMPTPTQQRLVRSASQFIAKRTPPGGSPGTTLLAGFPWFSDWGRDTMISLPGLLLSTSRFQQAGQVLSVFAGHVSDGMIPNNFDDYSNEPSYNTVDASLWFIHAVFQYLRATKDHDLFDSLLRPACQEVIEGYCNGTRYGIRMDPADALIWSGDATTQLTWMDAKMGDVVFTPRHGKAVEINALWYNALCLLNHTDLAARVKQSFLDAFWISPYRGLADVVTGALSRDLSVRPNQIFAVSLPHSPLSADQQKSVVEVVRRELLTPMGLRTLATGETGYRPRYTGNQFLRDQAYHNGTIWPWLIGPFLDAHLRVNQHSPDARLQARAWLKPLIDHLEDACVGSISEIMEAEPPHRAVGCCAQAWSVAEVLRLAIELEI
jgi:predicted glycogen debranching enzyme